MLNESDSKADQLPEWARADVQSGSGHQEADSQKSWFLRRPLPVYPIAAMYVLQWIILLSYMIKDRATILELLRTGAEPIVPFIAGFIPALITLLGGILLLYMRKAAIYCFGFTVAYGLYRAIAQDINMVGVMDWAVAVGIFIYCLRLRHRGLLK